MRLENLNSDRTHQNKLLFYLPFFRKFFINLDKILSLENSNFSLIVNSGIRQCLRALRKEIIINQAIRSKNGIELTHHS
jgi:hypothetical protein